MRSPSWRGHHGNASHDTTTAFRHQLTPSGLPPQVTLSEVVSTSNDMSKKEKDQSKKEKELPSLLAKSCIFKNTPIFVRQARVREVAWPVSPFPSCVFYRFQREWGSTEERGERGRGDRWRAQEPVTVKEPDKRQGQTCPILEHQTSQGEEGSPKSQKKVVSTWRMACGMTKDKTKDLLKRWRTLPDQGAERPPLQELKANTGDHGWSVHVWATWVKRCPSDDEPCNSDKEKGKSCSLTDSQREKLAYFFAHVFDMDRDDVIALQDFEGFTEVDRCILVPFELKTQNEIFSDNRDFKETLDDILNLNDCPEVEGSETSSDRFREWLTRKALRLRHFAEWSTNSGEYLILQQVQQGLIETFIYPLKRDVDSSESNENEERTPTDLDRLFLSMDDWLNYWGEILDGKKNFYDLPLWLQYLPKVVFTAINKSGSGCISKDELGAFYSSVMSYPPQKLSELLNEAYNAMTAGGDFKLNYDCYRLCFANFLFGRYPNGPGQFIFGSAQKSPPAIFPIDYSAMNTPPEDIEPYNGSLRSNRSSVIV
ncbi:hypothetical protein GE061_002046 [Apolygus lucorum]|uniref:EF-hand domain-containing protein n=1 Tax=Apolygus lucorum TaxID=248454 RepID=A0A8S9X428_APOLU|nr:hypothetical protein GE061_002046 [Apolygus lucorum]